MKKDNNMTEKLKKIPVIGTLVTLYSNKDKIYGFNYAPRLFEVDTLKRNWEGKYKIVFNIKRKLYDIEEDLGELIAEHLYLSKNNTNVVLVKRETPFGDMLGKFIVNKNNIIVCASKLYNSLVRLPIGGLLPPGTHLGDLLFSHLLLNNYLSLHASAVCINGEGFIIMAPSNTGKTVTTYNLISNGFFLLSDDITVVDLNNYIIHSCPYAGTYYHNSFIVDDLFKKGILPFSKKVIYKWNLWINNIPLLPFFLTFKQDYSPIYEYFKFNFTSKLKNICILQKGNKNEIYQLSNDYEKEAIAKKIKFLNSIEFSWWRNPLINVFGYIHPRYSIENLIRVERSLIKKLLEKCNVFIVTAKDSSKFHKMIIDTIL